ncbi:chaperonin 10-like protein [Vararia minispora EC-137]|uniref:Chaperonin 10-like protein n=1 Tax=Vararia minispora EC-137 TaxID=1314806 RepID=A0ACB8QGP4_9AGAM|nr:chaperonin 10-like protein [Vararia minispora EC-137]
MSFEYTIFTGGPGGEIRTKQVSRTKRPEDVVIKITHSGLCYTDIHQRHRDIALGHEGAGVVVDVGSAVRKLKVGDRVGFGFLRGTCGHCSECLTGDDMYCPGADLYSVQGASDVGSLASHAFIPETFAYKIPDSIPSAHAAPFMCAGATVFEALYRYGVRSGDRVGVLGVGGLGHLAIQFARAMGCTVIVFSTNESKCQEALELGAHEFIVFTSAEARKSVIPVNHLLVVSPRQPDWKIFIPLLAPHATIFPLTVDMTGDLTLPALPFIAKGMRVQGSNVAPRSVYAPLLSFAATHNVKPIVQEFPMTQKGLSDAFAALDAGTVRYRAVLVAQD